MGQADGGAGGADKARLPEVDTASETKLREDRFSDQQLWVRVVYLIAALAGIAAVLVPLVDLVEGDDDGPRSRPDEPGTNTTFDPTSEVTSPTTTPATTDPAANDPPPNECSTDPQKYDRHTAVQPSTESLNAGNLDFGSVVGYKVSAFGSNELRIDAMAGRVRGEVPPGYSLRLLATPEAHPDLDPPDQVEGNGRYYLVTEHDPFNPLPDGCWSYARPRVGVSSCGQTTVFTIALIADGAIDDLEAEMVPDPYSVRPGRVTAPDVLKLATFEVPTIQLCRPASPP